VPHFKVTGETASLDEIPIHEQVGGEGPRWYADMRGTEYAMLKGPAVAMSIPNVKSGISTSGLNGCVGLVYAYRPDGEYRLIVLAHVNCGTYGSVTGLLRPLDMAGRLAVEPEEVFVVGAIPTDAYAEYAAELSAWARGVPEENVFVYEGRGQSFVVTTEGAVGEPSSRSFREPMSTVHRDDVLLLNEAQRVKPPRARGCKCCCYLTTAACVVLGAGDDCHELQVLRWFRDRILLPDPVRARDVDHYYATAPGLVRTIEASPAPTSIYLEIFHGTIRPAVAAILEGRHDDAYDLYRRMVLGLEKRVRRADGPLP